MTLWWAATLDQLDQIQRQLTDNTSGLFNSLTREERLDIAGQIETAWDAFINNRPMLLVDPSFGPVAR